VSLAEGVTKNKTQSASSHEINRQPHHHPAPSEPLQVLLCSLQDKQVEETSGTFFWETKWCRGWELG